MSPCVYGRRHISMRWHVIATSYALRCTLFFALDIEFEETIEDLRSPAGSQVLAEESPSTQQLPRPCYGPILVPA
jgi:hypothetical protein